ncbi:MAG: tRNA preQ1(34) S-adenosylmethionine ribosyltransferase-isomerase QueA [Desulfobacteraceae bacterium]|jgi:S-adenosylmethionine:tRNA ribosyltransferase-isomerase|nr:tRNA preQ1(34) S-adenosylmethionine ribosyltransferase-isomerase QueA [Desulfobacteraceae bacterium]
MFSLDDYDYPLPQERIAQTPAARRDDARMLVLDRCEGAMAHRHFRDLPGYLCPGDVLVVNDTRVVCGRLIGRKPTGGRVELLILDYADVLRRGASGGGLTARCLVKAAKPTRVGVRLDFPEGLRAEVLGSENGMLTVRFEAGDDFDALVERIGHVPLPPYIHRPEGETGADRQAYQTIYAAKKGAVAAPTAGLHFTETLLEEIRRVGVEVVAVTLHVGYGTFLPVRVDDIRQHRMHAERFFISPETAETVNAARKAGRRVIAVGTTCVRTLEFSTDAAGRLIPGEGDCDLFIYPGYRFKTVDAMITNFHLPRSTLMMLVSAFAGRERIMHAYQAAVAAGYRFFSYGDAMFIR